MPPPLPFAGAQRGKEHVPLPYDGVHRGGDDVPLPYAEAHMVGNLSLPRVLVCTGAGTQSLRSWATGLAIEGGGGLIEPPG